ncbi:MAG: VpaChn25_0724 family phage protein [Panacagrimonas sp.]
MNKYFESVMGDVRLMILNILDSMPEGTLTVGQLDRVLDGQPGDHLARDEIEGQITWLESAGLVTLERIAATCWVRVTQRGLDVARGQAKVPGVTRLVDRRLSP